MDKQRQRMGARHAPTAGEVQQVLPGIDRDAVHVRSARPSPIARQTRVTRYEDLPDVLTPAEVQGFLRIGRNAIYAALQDRKIRSVRVGQKYLIPKSAVREFLDRDGEHSRAGIPVKGTT
jgi:excisionase family DNA binding protein